MSASTPSASQRGMFRLRRVAPGTAVTSALLVTCWSVGVGARQTNPKTGSAPAKTTPSAPLIGKTVSPPSAPAPAANAPKMGSLKLFDFVVDERTGIGTGHKFEYTSGDTVITGDNGRYDKNQDVLDADTNLILDDPKHHITGDKSHVERKKARLVVNGRVVLTVKPETNGANDDPNASVEDAKKQGAVVNCDEIESFYKRKFNILRGHLVFKQHIIRPGKEPLERTGTAEHAEYDGKKEILVLFPPVHGEDSENKKFDSDKNKVIISTKAGQETMSGAQGIVVFPVREIDDEDGDTPPNTSTPTTEKSTDTKKDTGTTAAGKPNSK